MNLDRRDWVRTTTRDFLCGPESGSVKRIKWPVQYNRPLSTEERAIAAKLATDPVTRVVKAPQGWVSPLCGPREDAPLLQEEEA